MVIIYETITFRSNLSHGDQIYKRSVASLGSYARICFVIAVIVSSYLVVGRCSCSLSDILWILCFQTLLPVGVECSQNWERGSSSAWIRDWIGISNSRCYRVLCQGITVSAKLSARREVGSSLRDCLCLSSLMVEHQNILLCKDSTRTLLIWAFNSNLKYNHVSYYLIFIFTIGYVLTHTESKCLFFFFFDLTAIITTELQVNGL